VVLTVVNETEDELKLTLEGPGGTTEHTIPPGRSEDIPVQKGEYAGHALGATGGVAGSWGKVEGSEIWRFTAESSGGLRRERQSR
jgi:hypothetical protein